MIAGTLSRYIARRMATSALLVIATIAVIALLGNYIETLQSYGDEESFNGFIALKLALMRIPFMIDQILPFAFLFAAILALVGLSRRQELVVARATGISVWRFLLPAFVVAFVFGLFATFILNPVAIELRSERDKARAEFRTERDDSSAWFRQGSVDGSSIIYAAQADSEALILFGVTAFVFDSDENFREKVTARRADFGAGRWTLRDATLISADAARDSIETYILPTNLDGNELRLAIAEPETFTIWTLPAFIEAASRAGQNINRFRLTFHTLLARPLFLMAMVMVAATVSLRFSRYGGTLRLVLTGVVGGFLLYVLTEIIGDLGGNGIINPIVAAWLPSIVALSFGGTALLYLEDG
jgi:lipopolysaccharide export system permease protein